MNVVCVRKLRFVVGMFLNFVDIVLYRLVSLVSVVLLLYVVCRW